TIVLGLSGNVQAREPHVPQTPPLEIKVPNFDVKTLSCGMKVLFLRNDDLPLVSVNLLMPGGYVTDPVGKEGLVALMDASLRNGGAGKLSPEAFDAALENRAASMDAGADVENFSAGFKCLAGDLSDILGLFADMVRRPQFDPKRFETDKAESIDSLNRLEDTPDNLTRVLFYRGLMGHSPYGRWSSPKSVSGITREDVTRFYAKNYGPEGSVLSVTGNFDEDKVTAQLEKLFGDWKNSTAQEKRKDAEPLGPTIYFFPKDVSQVFIRYGVLGLKRHDPRQVPLEVANYILGGSGFTSRLMREIRSNRGLAYFVDSVAIPYNVRGIFEVIGGTRPDSVKEYLDTMFKVMGDYSKDGPTDKELIEAKQSMVEEFAYEFESPFTLAPYKASLDFHGYPADYLETYRDKVKAVTRDQAAEAAKAILDQKDWVMVVCGPASLEKDLSAFGNVVKVSNIFDPLGKP
ncbi:MAG TPA: pitrilysin family protein, partial [Puia sp.]|nr:pitrilysin family protein [Puia sp.]